MAEEPAAQTLQMSGRVVPHRSLNAEPTSRNLALWNLALWILAPWR